MTNTTLNTDQSTPDQSTDLSDGRPQFFAAVDLARQVVAGVLPDQRHLPTPCETMDVDVLCGHLLAVIGRVGHIGRGGNALDLPGLTEIEPDGGWLAAWDGAIADTAAVWTDDALLESTVLVPWGSTTGREAIAVYVNEFTVHTWDIATTIGVAPQWNHDVLAVALDAMERTLPAEGRIQSFELAFAGVPDAHLLYPFAAAVDAAETAPLIDRLVAYNGRQPIA